MTANCWFFLHSVLCFHFVHDINNIAHGFCQAMHNCTFSNRNITFLKNTENKIDSLILFRLFWLSLSLNGLYCVIENKCGKRRANENCIYGWFWMILLSHQIPDMIGYKHKTLFAHPKMNFPSTTHFERDHRTYSLTFENIFFFSIFILYLDCFSSLPIEHYERHESYQTGGVSKWWVFNFYFFFFICNWRWPIGFI